MKNNNFSSNAYAGESAREMQIRRMPFEFPDEIDPHWNPRLPEWSHMANGASLAMPFLEPYLIRTLRKAGELIDSEALKADVKLYMGQEAQHYQQHRKFNDTLIANGYVELAEVERKLSEDYKRMEENRSLKFNLAYAAGFESMALGIGHWLIRDREHLFGDSDTKVASLILWHFVEEIEHKNVAIDAYNYVYGDYFYRIYGMLYSTFHILKYSRIAYKLMLERDGLWKSLASRWRLMKIILRFHKNVLPSFFEACLPNHHPSKRPDPQWCNEWLDLYQQEGHTLEQIDTKNLTPGFS